MTAQRLFKIFRIFGVLVLVAMLPSCAETQLAAHYAKKIWNTQDESQGRYKVGDSYRVKGKTYHPEERFSYTETGIASWYGPGFNGKRTANGEIYDQSELTAAHKTLQMPSLVRVTNLENGRSVVVRINDRGPFKPGRIIDMSERGAELLGFKKQGTARVRIEVLEQESRQIAAAAKAGKDVSEYQVASLNTPAGRFSPPVIGKPGFEPVALRKPNSAILLNDAEMMPLPESLRPEVMERGGAIISSRPLDLSIETVEVSELGNLEPQELASKTVKPAGAEMDFLKQLDFMQQSKIQGHDSQGRFVPDPVVTQTAVVPNNIYVQAGAFKDYRNAERLAASLADIGVANITPVTVSDSRFYRVRIGPIQDVNNADAVLAKVVGAGQENARIIVD